MAHPDPPLDLVAVTVALRHMVGASQELTARLSRQLDLNSTDSQALELLDRQGPMGAAELARRLGIRSASATVLIDRLEGAGHVERRRDGSDRRRVTVVPTASAERATMAIWREAIMAIDEVGRSLGPDEQRIVDDYLQRVTQAMAGVGEPTPPRAKDKA